MAEQLTPEGEALKAALAAYDQQVTEAVADLTKQPLSAADKDRRTLEEAAAALGKPGILRQLDIITQTREQKG